VDDYDLWFVNLSKDLLQCLSFHFYFFESRNSIDVFYVINQLSKVLHYILIQGNVILTFYQTLLCIEPEATGDETVNGGIYKFLESINPTH
jgi:hypothetical protein